MASPVIGAHANAKVAVFTAESTPAQGSLNSAGAGITGGYTSDSLPLQVIIAFLLGLSLYNSIELIILIFVTFQRFHGLYFWSLVIAAFGIVPYSLGFLIKFFQLLDPNQSTGYIAVVLLTIGWYAMVTGQSVVLWSRLHLLTHSRLVLRWTLFMIIMNGVLLHSITTVLTFGSNSNSLTRSTLQHFINGYSIMEKIQMVIFFIQEFILSGIYIREAIRLLKLSETVQNDVQGYDNASEPAHLRNENVRKTMYQLLAINVIIISMDLVLLGVEFANLYLIETTLKGVVYSIKLKLEFAVLGKLVQIVRIRNASSDHSSLPRRSSAMEPRATLSGAVIEKTETNRTNNTTHSPALANSSLLYNSLQNGISGQQLPHFVDSRSVSADITHARMSVEREGGSVCGWETRVQDERENSRRRAKGKRGSWIDEEIDKHNIG